jgi:hypothetical protein
MKSCYLERLFRKIGGISSRASVNDFSAHFSTKIVFISAFFIFFVQGDKSGVPTSTLPVPSQRFLNFTALHTDGLE